MGMMEHECKGLIDTGSTLPLISLNLANTIEQSQVWTKHMDYTYVTGTRKSTSKLLVVTKSP